MSSCTGTSVRVYSHWLHMTRARSVQSPTDRTESIGNQNAAMIMRGSGRHRPDRRRRDGQSVSSPVRPAFSDGGRAKGASAAAQGIRAGIVRSPRRPRATGRKKRILPSGTDVEVRATGLPLPLPTAPSWAHLPHPTPGDGRGRRPESVRPTPNEYQGTSAKQAVRLCGSPAPRSWPPRPDRPRSVARGIQIARSVIPSSRPGCARPAPARRARPFGRAAEVPWRPRPTVTARERPSGDGEVRQPSGARFMTLQGWSKQTFSPFWSVQVGPDGPKKRLPAGRHPIVVGMPDRRQYVVIAAIVGIHGRDRLGPAGAVDRDREVADLIRAGERRVPRVTSSVSLTVPGFTPPGREWKPTARFLALISPQKTVVHVDRRLRPVIERTRSDTRSWRRTGSVARTRAQQHRRSE